MHRTSSFCECYFCQDGFTPFHMAVMLGDEDLAKLLLLRGADINAVATVSKSIDLFLIYVNVLSVAYCALILGKIEIP